MNRQTGSATLELAIVSPALILTLLLAIEAAARDAARQASIARDPAAARTQATTSAQTTLHAQHIDCPATITAHLTCPLHLSDIAAPGFPGTETITAQFTSPIDPYRARS